MQRTKSRENSPTDDKIQIFVNDLAGKTTTLTVLPTTRVSSLKTLLSSKLAIAESELRLVFAGKLLASPSSTLQSYNIQNKSTLNLALALKGGVLNPADAAAGAAAPSVPVSDSVASSSTNVPPIPAKTVSRPGKKPRCDLPTCNAFAQKIIGDCQFCDGHFCGKHRMLEDHDCTGLEDCKRKSHEQNKAKLEAERTSAVRMM